MAQQKQKKNFFQQLIEKYGAETCMDQVDPKTVYKNIKGVFKDIAFENIDLIKYEPFIRHNVFIEHATAAIDEEYCRHCYHYTALHQYITQNGTNEFITKLYQEDQMKTAIYETIRNAIYNYKQTNDYRYFFGLKRQSLLFLSWFFNPKKYL